MITTLPIIKSTKKSFIEEISEIGQTIFVDILAKETIKRQTNLLIWLVITILISLAYVDITETTLQGLKLKPTDKIQLNYVVGSVCLYLIAVFIVSILKDISANGYKFFSITPKVDHIIRSLNHEVQIKQWRLFDALEKPVELISYRLQEEDKIRQKYRPQLEALRERSLEITLSGRADRFLKENTEIDIKMDVLEEKQKKEIKSLYSEIDQRVKESADIANDIEIEWEIIERKVNAFTNLLRLYTVFYFLFLVIEIAFPISVGMFVSLLSFGMVQ